MAPVLAAVRAVAPVQALAPVQAVAPAQDQVELISSYTYLTLSRTSIISSRCTRC